MWRTSEALWRLFGCTACVQIDVVFLYLFAQVWLSLKFSNYTSLAVGAVGVIIRCIVSAWLRCAARPHDMYFEAKALSVLCRCRKKTWFIRPGREGGVCVWELAGKGGGSFKETAKTQKLYLSLLDWLIIELPRSCIEQSVLCEKKYFSLKSISLLAQQGGGDSFLSVWAADWITKASREQVYSFSLTKKQQQEKCPGWERKESSSEFQSQRAAGRHS